MGQLPKEVQLMDAVYEGVFQFADVLVGITKQEKLLEIHRKIGYVYGCAVPYFFDSDPAYIVYLTKSGYRSGKVYAVARKERETNGRRRRNNSR